MESEMSKQHFRAIDIAKGIGIILVVLGHSLKQTEVNARWIKILICLIYSFHMPLFFALSGFLAEKVLRLETMKERLVYVKNRALRLLVPYFVIGLVYIPVKLKLRAYAVKPFTLRDSLGLLIGQNPNTSLWFLYVLFIVSAICALFVHESNFRSFLYGAGALSVASCWVNISLKTPKYLFFFLAGMWVRKKYEDARAEGKTYLFEGQTGAVIIAAVIFLLLNRYYYKTGINILRMGTSICGIYMVLWLSEGILKAMEGSFLFRTLEKAGACSMDIYILHEPVMTVAKIVFWNKLALPYGICTGIIFLCALLIPVPVSNMIIRRIWLLRFLLLGEKRSTGAAGF